MANFIKSANIKAFPAGFRKDALDTSKLTTEENLTSLTILSSDKTIGNRWITNPLNDKEDVIYIRGYKFVFPKKDIPENCTWVAIQLRELGVGNNNKTNVLKPVDAVGPNASVLDDEGGNFLGLGFYENEPSGDDIYKVKKDSSLVLNSSEIKNGTSDTNIAEQFNTKKITVGSIIINENNSANISGVNTVNGLALDGTSEKISIKAISGDISSLTVADDVKVDITSNETTLGNIKLTKEGADIKINDFKLPKNTEPNKLLTSDGKTNSWISYSENNVADTIVKRSGNDIKAGTLNGVKIWLDETKEGKEPILSITHQFEPAEEKKSGLGIERPATLTVTKDGSIQTDINNDGTNVISIGAGTLIKQDLSKNFVQIGNTTGVNKVITLPLEGMPGGVLYDKGNNVAEWRATANSVGSDNKNKVAVFNDDGTIEGLAPTNHSTDNKTIAETYGLAAVDTYGHVKLHAGDLSDAVYENGVAASAWHNHNTIYAPIWGNPFVTPIELGSNTAGNLTYGSTINIPKFLVDERGIVNEGQDTSLKLPAAYNKVSIEKVFDYPEERDEDRIIYLTGVSRFEFNKDLGEKSAVDTTLQLYYNKKNQVPVYINNGNLYAPQLYLTSDKRLKENERPYKSDKSILDLPIYKYDYINGSKNQIGCMAQDLKEICPEIVEEDEKGYLHIQESKIVYLLIEEIKKLKEEIKNLKNN